MLDVTSEIIINRPRSVVSGFSADPDNVPLWYENIKFIAWQSEPPLQEGTRVAFVASFLGRRLAYTYEMVEYLPGERLVMRTSEGPFPMETTYTWESTTDGGTRMALRNRGAPRGFPALLAPFMAVSMRRANRKDLLRLKALLEQDTRPG